MSRPDFAELAARLLTDTIEGSGSLTEAHAGLIVGGEVGGALDAVLRSVAARELVQAVLDLDTAERIASKPPAPPTEGRYRLDRHQRNQRQRDHLLTVAQVCRVLVLDAMKCGSAA